MQTCCLILCHVRPTYSSSLHELTPKNKVVLEEVIVTQRFKKFPALSNLKIHFHAYKIPPLMLIMRQMNNIQKFPPCFFMIHLNIIIKYTVWSQKYSLPSGLSVHNSACISYTSRAFFMSRQTYPRSLHSYLLTR